MLWRWWSGPESKSPWNIQPQNKEITVYYTMLHSNKEGRHGHHVSIRPWQNSGSSIENFLDPTENPLTFRCTGCFTGILMIWFYFKPSVSGQDLKLPYTVHPKQQKPGALFSWLKNPIILDPQFLGQLFRAHESDRLWSKWSVQDARPPLPVSDPNF